MENVGKYTPIMQQVLNCYCGYCLEEALSHLVVSASMHNVAPLVAQA